MSSIRTTTLGMLDNSPEISTIIMSKLTFAHCVYLLSVLKLETLRVTHSSDARNLEGLFAYLEDDTIIKDKAGMIVCMEAVTKKAFDLFMKVKKEQVSC